MTLMLMLTWLLTDNAAEPTTFFRETAIFEPVTKNEVAATDDGHLYVLHFDERKVLHYGSDGTLLGEFGRAGEGPGEFGHPSRVLADAHHIYVQDLGRDLIHVFKRDGTFVEVIRTPTGIALERIEGGWIYGNFTSMMDQQPIAITITDYHFKEKKEVLQLKRGSERGLRIEMNGGGGKPQAKYNPVSDGPSLAAGSDGKYAYARAANSNLIHVIDIAAAKESHSFELENPALPFNEAFGQEKFDEIADRMKSGHTAIELVPDFPETFPPLREMTTDHQGNLLIRLWSGQPDKIERYLRVDRNGKELPLPCKPAGLTRLMAVVDGQAVINAYTEEDDAYFVRVPLSQLDKAVATYENEGERKPRMLMRTN